MNFIVYFSLECSVCVCMCAESGSFSDIFYGSPQTATGDFEREQTFLMKKG